MHEFQLGILNIARVSIGDGNMRKLELEFAGSLSIAKNWTGGESVIAHNHNRDRSVVIHICKKSTSDA